MARVWHKVIAPKLAHETFGIYQGKWFPEMDRCWESEDGYSVSSRLIRTDWGVVEHATIQHLGGFGDVPWSVKQEIKDELFGEKRAAIEVFPARKNLVDVCDVYHLWVLPKDFRIPFGIHPHRDPQGFPVQRGYDCDVRDPALMEWINSDARRSLLERGLPDEENDEV